MPRTSQSPSHYRSSGFWLAATMAAFLVVNTVRGLIAPEAFSGYFGAPLASPDDAGWVAVYALRTGLIAAIIILLLAARQLRLVGWVALMGAALPVGDFMIASYAGAPQSTLIRHAVISFFLLVTAWRLFAFPRSEA
jgi:hypothetical protein